MKKMIFHIPNKIDKNLVSGSQIRPLKMLKAFEDIGYEVDVVMGYVKDRKKQIKQIKANIRNGVKYDFLYSESSTMPTALTEIHHFPIAPFLDFNFFKFCKRYNIKIGLFYRDIYWIFDVYKNGLSLVKSKLAILFYKYDLYQYNKHLDILYLPSEAMGEYIPINLFIEKKPLPPALEQREFAKNRSLEKTSFIYVGGINDIYDLTLFCEVSNELGMRLSLCTREDDWSKNKVEYKKYLNDISVYHLKGKELEKIYEKASIAVYFVKPNVIWNFAMGVKLFEYIAYKKPILAVKGTAVGSFVEEKNIGWTIDYTREALESLLLEIEKKPTLIEDKVKNIEKIMSENTWKARAKQVQKELNNK